MTGSLDECRDTAPALDGSGSMAWRLDGADGDRHERCRRLGVLGRRGRGPRATIGL